MDKYESKSDDGLLLVLSGPSGVGKGTVCTELRKTLPELTYSVSATTRPMRQGEIEGQNYFFKTKEEFKEMIENDKLLEWAEYVDNYYGTPWDFVQQALQSGKDVILEVEVQGALKIKDKFPDAVFIFLAPPDLGELRNRIVGRGTETEASVNDRMAVAKKEIELMDHYNYVVMNDRVALACRRIESIIVAEHLQKDRQIEKYRQWLKEV